MNDDFLSEWYACDDGIELVTHVVSPRVTIVEQIDDFRGTLGCDVFVDERYRGSVQELEDAIAYGQKIAHGAKRRERGL